MDFDDEEEKKTTKAPKFPIQMYISEGNQYLRLGKYDLAIELFNKGLEKEPANEKCLIGRSKCYMRLAKYVEAKDDAEAVVKAHPNSYDARMLIGEANYFLGDFEKAFLTFYRGHASRPNHDGLRCGHQMCKKAIDNSLKPDVPIVIDDEDVRNIHKLKEDLNIEQASKSMISQDRYSKHIDYVTSILHDDAAEFAHQDCEYVKDYLRDRQIFWRTQNPKTSKESRTDSIANGGEEKSKNNIPVFDSHETDQVLSNESSNEKQDSSCDNEKIDSEISDFVKDSSVKKNSEHEQDN